MLSLSIINFLYNIKQMKKIFTLFVTLFIYVSPANAACDFIINIGDKGGKLFEKFAIPMLMFEGQFMLPVQAPELCPNDNLNDMIAVEYVFLGETEETANLAAIRMIALNDGENTESNKLTLMNYAKKVYGDFDTGQNPQIFNNFYVWEKNNKLIIYKRLLDQENLVDEEIFITNDEYDMKLGEFYNKLEQNAEAKDES